MIESGIYQGLVTHRRFSPVSHEFCYKISMILFDLDESTSLLSKVKLKFLSFDQSKYLENCKGETLKQRVLSNVSEKLLLDGTEKVYLLTQLKSLGILFNPVSFYYVYNKKGLSMLAEVNNTPWLETHTYTLVEPIKSGAYYQYDFSKEFHVSPFLSMDFTYKLKANLPDDKLFVHMENWKNDDKAFDATLALKKLSWSQNNIDKVFLKHPFSTIKVIASIYWEVLKIYLKGNPFYSHPGD